MSTLDAEGCETQSLERGTHPDDTQDELARCFGQLAEEWRRETRLTSSLMKKAEHPAYQSIIQMGRPVVPLILRELERQPGHWFVALTAITGENPIRPEDAGDLKRMTEVWLDFARRNGYIE